WTLRCCRSGAGAVLHRFLRHQFEQLLQARVRVVLLQQHLALPLGHRQQLGQPPPDPGRVVDLARPGVRGVAADLLEDALQQHPEHRMLRAQFVVAVGVAPLDVAHHQAVVAHPGAGHAEAAVAAHAQGQHALVVAAEVLDPRLGAERSGPGRGAGFLAGADHADAEAAAAAAALAHQVEVARFEHAQADGRPRHQHRVQRKQPDRLLVHARTLTQPPSKPLQVPPAAIASRNRRGAPSKPPLDMNTTWSPSRTSARRVDTRAATSATAWPSPRSAATTLPASQASPGRCRNTTASAPASEGASASACAPSRIELLRGSIATTMRASPTRARRPARVVAIAVGWCAESSYTVTPAWLPRTSSRRFTPRNPASAGNAAATSAPAACAAAIAARPFITLCRPSSGQCTSPRAAPRCSTSNALPSVASRRACQSSPSPSMPKRSTGVQQPISSTSARRASSPLTTSRPRRGTVRTRWWNWRWIAATSGKMSAWS